jgi:hypothetical protein
MAIVAVSRSISPQRADSTRPYLLERSLVDRRHGDIFGNENQHVERDAELLAGIRWEEAR